MRSTSFAGLLAGPVRPGLASPSRAGAGRIGVYLALLKPRIVSLVLFTSVAACTVAAAGAPPVATLALLLASGCLAAGGAAALNHYLDRDIDVRMARTRGRPLAQGQVRRPGLVLLAGLALVAAGVGLALAANPRLAFFEALGAFIYTVVYTRWLKRRTPLNIVIGGGAGSAAVLGGWAAVDPALGLAPWLLAGVVFTWTPAHFWSFALARADDYRRAGVPMLPAVVSPRATAAWVVAHVAATAGLSVWAGLAGGLGPLYFATALGAGLLFLGASLHLLRQPTPALGWRVFKCSGGYLGLLFLGLLVDALARAPST